MISNLRGGVGSFENRKKKRGKIKPEDKSLQFIFALPFRPVV